MKNENTNTVTITSKNPSVLDIVNAARKNNPDGSIQIDELEKKLNLSRLETIEQCRAIDKDDIFLKVGRRGGSSCLLIGKPALDFRANRHSSKTKTKVNSAQVTPKTGMNAFEYLRLHFGNQQLDVKLDSMELV